MTGFVARSRDDTSLAGAAHDDRLASQLRSAEELDGHEERVHVHVQDRADVNHHAHIGLPSPAVSPSIRDDMQAGLRAAMQSREQLTVSVLRSTLAAMANAEAVDPTTAERHATEVERKLLSDDDIRDIITVERDELRRAADEMSTLGQAAKADELTQQAAVLDGYLTA